MSPKMAAVTQEVLFWHAVNDRGTEKKNSSRVFPARTHLKVTIGETQSNSRVERMKEGRWREWDDRHSHVLMSVHLAREEGGSNLDGGGREWQRREINLRFVLINLPKLLLFWGEMMRRRAQTSRHKLELRQGFSGKLPRRECRSTERERNGREKKAQARFGRVLSQLSLSVCSAIAQRKSKIPQVQELSFSAKN